MHQHARLGRENSVSNLSEILDVRPEENRSRKEEGFEYVLASVWSEASSYKRHETPAVNCHQITHGIHDHNVGGLAAPSFKAEYRETRKLPESFSSMMLTRLRSLGTR